VCLCVCVCVCACVIESARESVCPAIPIARERMRIPGQETVCEKGGGETEIRSEWANGMVVKAHVCQRVTYIYIYMRIGRRVCQCATYSPLQVGWHRSLEIVS